MACSIDKKAEFVPEWKGWGEYFDFWDQFVKVWYDCKGKANDPNALPTDMLTNSIRPLFDAKKEDSRLSKDELPEPYCIEPGVVGVGKSFDPTNVGLVVVQMNPGAAQSKNKKDEEVNLEATKFYSNKDKDEGFLIRDFADENTCDKKFSKWVERWSCFRETYPSPGCVLPVGCGVRPSDVCGHDWWHNKNRKNWFKSFADAELNQVLALETIPYHSKNFDITKSLQDDEFKSYLLRRVLLPAGICAQSSLLNKFKLVVCCGGELRKFLGELEGLKVECSEGVAVSKILTWERPHKNNNLIVEEHEINVSGSNEEQELQTRWPKKDEGYKERWYELYRCEILYSEGSTRKICRFLVLSIYANSMKFPGVDFQRAGGVEELLKERIKEEEKNISEKVPLYVAKDALAGKKDGSIGWMSNPDRIGPVIIDRESLQRLIKDKKD